MAKKTIYPNSYNSSTGGKFQPFKNLKNLHTKSTSSYANTELVHGKKQPLNRPGTVTVSNFKASLPSGSVITKITIHYAHSKVEYNNKVCNIPAPSISLMSGNKVIKYSNGKEMTRTGKAPTTKIENYNVSFTGNWTSSEINSSNFGVKIDYPTNTNDLEGYMRLYNVYIDLEYRSPSFGVNISPAKSKGYNGDRYSVSVFLNNKNNTKEAPTLTITCPAGFNLVDTGQVTKIDNRTFTWKPKISGVQQVGIGLDFDVNVTFPSGSSSYSGTFSVSESYSGKSNSFTATITPKPAKEDTVEGDEADSSLDDGTDGGQSTYTPTVVTVGEEFTYTIQFSEDEWASILQYWEENPPAPRDVAHVNYSFTYTGQGIAIVWSIPLTDFDENHSATVSYTYTEEGYRHLSVWLGSGSASEVYRMYPIIVRPKEEDLSVPNVIILTLTEEELNRLGHTTSYMLQSNVKEVTQETYVRDWYKNFRIGLFNNPIRENVSVVEIPPEDPNDPPTELIIDNTDYDNLTVDEIVKHADYWSNCLITPNEYENLKCKFVYNKNYPLYVLITGDYPESSTYQSNNVKFTEPCIIEDTYYDGRETNGTYPIPIENTKLSTGDFGELNIESLGTASPLIFYDLPLDENYGTDENIAIRGLEVTGTVEQNTDDLNIYCKLISPTGKSRTRSINLDALDTNPNSDNKFSLGGMGDIWGLSTLDIVNLEDWEIELMVDNTVNTNTGTINFSNIALTIYIAEIESQNIQCKVEDEDLAYYGAFITDVEIPEGLKTDTDFLTIEGTDTNDPYRQNIREKEITIHLDIGDNCDLEGSTLSLRDLARLLQNKRDKYNRPIPKKIEFSHYPDVYWEYIMESPFDNPIEISSYEVKIKLTIPSGTAYKKTATSTNRVGYVNGLANVSPVLVVKPTDSLITITETLTDQNFHISYPTDITNKVIVIDCEDRIVWLKTDEDDEDGENITSYVDFNSDWFSIIEEYQFETTGCVIKDVSYIERW